MAGLVTAKTFTDNGEAHIVKAKLEANGIPAFLFDEHMGGNMYPSVAIFGVRLMVSEVDLESALALVSETDGALASGGADTCPKCGSGDIFRHSSLIGGIAAFMFGLALFLRTGERYCRQCRHRWRPETN